jgi:hypothetical protein
VQKAEHKSVKQSASSSINIFNITIANIPADKGLEIFKLKSLIIQQIQKATNIKLSTAELTERIYVNRTSIRGAEQVFGGFVERDWEEAGSEE